MVILNEVGQDEKLNRLKRNLEHNPDVLFNEVFGLFYMQTSGRIMEITFTEMPA
ncbi:putative membrane protein [Pedobacter sp. CAN_A7]|uniref:hypothetical protein n=1 Tax=Pedobacter sp. CAN_A7 TaxID=2787722 RepID=UPI0018CBDB1D